MKRKGEAGLCLSLAGFYLLSMVSCLPLLDWRAAVEFDYKPPVLTGWHVLDEKTLILEMDEELAGDALKVEILPQSELTIETVPFGCIDDRSGSEAPVVENHQIRVLFTNPMISGHLYSLWLEVEDHYRNRLKLMLRFYGFNPNPPLLLLNEVRLEGSSSRPDLVEFFCLQSGNSSGVSFYRGIPENYDFEYILPSVDIEKGDYILLHIKPDGILEEIDELDKIDISGGRESSLSARDFWLKTQEGLSATNGVLSLCYSPGGTVMDCFVYSNRTSLSDVDYHGFGTYTNQLRADSMGAIGEWLFDGEWIVPEDCFMPVDGTSTRTLCRDSSSGDTQSVSDWHIVPTGMCSFGSCNSDKKYQP